MDLSPSPDRKPESKSGLEPRLGVIIEWPLNGQFHDTVTDVLTSQTTLGKWFANDNVNPWLLGKILKLLFAKMMLSNVLGS